MYLGLRQVPKSACPTGESSSAALPRPGSPRALLLTTSPSTVAKTRPAQRSERTAFSSSWRVRLRNQESSHQAPGQSTGGQAAGSALGGLRGVTEEGKLREQPHLAQGQEGRDHQGLVGSRRAEVDKLEEGRAA